MKNSSKKIAGFLLMAFTLLLTPKEAWANTVNNKIVIVVNDDLIGEWEYFVAGAPEGFDKGIMTIIKQGDMYRIEVQLNAGPVNAENVVIKENKITFTVNIEGEDLIVALDVKENKISGTSTSPSNGTLSITGYKSILPQ